VRETPDRIVIYDGPRELTTHPREAEPRCRYVFRPEHRPPRGQGWRHARDPVPEETALLRLLPESAAYLAGLKQRGKLQTTLALRQLLRMAREYPREPLLRALLTDTRKRGNRDWRSAGGSVARGWGVEVDRSRRRR
jgi:hypothetical protein